MLEPVPQRRPFLVLTLVLLALAVVRVSGQWIQRSSIVASLGPSASADRVSFVKESNSVHISNLQWSENLNASLRLDVSVASTWAKILPDQLLLKRFHSPHLILDGVTLQLHSDDSSRNRYNTVPTLVEQWRDLLADRRSQLQPDKMLADAKSIRKAAELQTDWTGRFKAWGDYGTRVLEESKTIRTRLDGLNENPLRHEREIVSGLARLQAYSQDLERVESEVKDSEKVLETHRRLLVNLKQADLHELESKYVLRPQAASQSFGQRIVHQWLVRVWSNQAKQAEAVEALISDWMCRPVKVDRGRDLRKTDTGTLAISVSAAAARGDLVFADEHINFLANGVFKLSSATKPQCEAAWRFAFNTPTFDSVLVAKVEPGQSENSCSLAHACYQKLAATTKSTDEVVPVASQPMFQFECTVCDKELSGTGSMDITQWLMSALPGGPDELITVNDLPADIYSATKPQIAKFRIESSWTDPKLTLLDDAAAWITKKLETQLNSESIATKQSTEQLLERQLQTAIQDLNRVVAENRSRCLAHSKQLRQQLLSLRNSIQRDLELRTDLNVAQRQKSLPVSR